MRRNHIPSILIFFALTVVARAQVRGPIMGYLPEKGALRILNGIPGAGSVSAPHLSDRTLSLIEVSPDQTRALAIAADTGALVSLTPGAESTALIDGAAPARIALRSVQMEPQPPSGFRRLTTSRWSAGCPQPLRCATSTFRRWVPIP